MKRALLLLFFGAALHGQALRDLAAQRGIWVGAAVNPSHFGEAPYADTLAREFSQVEPENAMKFAAIHPGPTTYAWDAADAVVNFAQAHNMAIRGHTLMWHQASGAPPWLTGLSSTDLAKALQDHISTVVGRYAGKVYAWDVVNEAFNDNGTIRSTIWSDSPGMGFTGTGHIEAALRWARAADPQALLFYNDYSAEWINSKSDAIYKMAQDFKARGVPLDGIGMQMHFTLNSPAIASIEANMKRFTDLGLQVQITELDVRLPVDSTGVATADALAAQAKIYGDIVATCLKFPKCTAVQTWGFTDRYSWVPSSYAGMGAALPFDGAYTAKPARDAMASAMQTAPAVISAAGLVNAASYAGGAVAPGEIVVLFNATYGPPALQLPTGTPATKLGAVRLLFDGVAAPLLYSKLGQVGAVVPFSVAGKTSTSVQYEYQGVGSNVLPVAVQTSLPGVFTLDASGAGAGAILNASTFGVISKDNPAKGADWLAIFATGLGATSPASADGQIYGSTLMPAVANVSVMIGNMNCRVLYAGSAPGLVAGAAQINVEVPVGVASGDQPVVVTVDGVASQPGVVVRIR